MRIAIEAGTHSLRGSEDLRQLGHEVLVANARDIRAITHSACERWRERSTRLGQALRLSASHCSKESFAARCRADLPQALLEIAELLLKQIELATEQIALCDQQIEKLADEVYCETKALRQISGVGALTALIYVLTWGTNSASRAADVGCYCGLRPRRSYPAMPIHNFASRKPGTSTCATCLCKVLIMCSGTTDQIVPCGSGACAFVNEAERTRRSERAIIAVARRLSVLLHRLWITQAEYLPFYEGKSGRLSRIPRDWTSTGTEPQAHHIVRIEAGLKSSRKP